jgi:hypothetical protein
MSAELPAGKTRSPARLIAVIGLSLTLAYVVVLVSALYNGNWLLDAEGRPIASDFVNVWAAGRLTGDGHPALAYDWTIHREIEVRAVGHAFDGYYGWHYSPTFLFVAATLALIPIVPATLVWLAVTLPPYLIAVRAIVGERAGYLLALGFPAALWNVTASQNGFLTAALIGGTLALLQRQPIAAGVCLGLLTYKPHFGLLFPVAFLAAQHWRVLIAAAITATLMIVVSWLAFGTSTWVAFFAATPKMTEAVLGQGLAEFDRLQSVFGLVRAQGGNASLAWAAQIATAIACAVAIFALWRSHASYEFKAAGLVAAALIATPYLYIYDFVVLAIPAAYLVRLGLSTGFTLAERIGLPSAALLLLSYPYLKTQVGLAAAIIVAGLIARCLFTAKSTAVPTALSSGHGI